MGAFFRGVMQRDIETEVLQEFLVNIDEYPLNKEIIFVTGRPGSGKSTYIQLNKLVEKYCLIDTDIVIKFIKEKYNIASYNNILKHAFTIRHKLLLELISKGLPIIFPTTINIQALYDYIDIAYSKGYKIKIFHLNTSKETAVENCIKRSMEDKNRDLHLKWLNNDFFDQIPQEFARHPKVNFEIVKINKSVY